MKKLITLILALSLCATLSISLAGCKETSHSHTYVNTWSTDHTHHWHACEDVTCDAISDKADHTWNEGEVTTAPTCGKEGVKTFTCTVCGEEKTEAIPKLTPHSWNAGVETTAPTCGKEGVKTFTCTACGEEKTEAIDKLTSHNWNAGVQTTAPTCGKEGVKTFTCLACGEEKTEAIDKVTTHVWNVGDVTTPATCGEAGEMTYTCILCLEKRTESIPKDPNHEYNIDMGYSVVDGVAYTNTKCVCGDIYSVVVENAIVATPETAQDVLDGKLGSLDEKTVVFALGEYTEKLYFGRPNSSEGSNTIYKGLQSSTIIEGIDNIKAMTWGSRYYTRAISNLTLVAENGVVLPTLEASSGHIHGSGYDYVLDQSFSGSGYFLTHIFENITFDGLSFNGKVDFETAQGATLIGQEVFQPATSMNGLNFINCSFTTGGTQSSNDVALRVYSEMESDNQVIKNVLVDNCEFNNCYQGIYTHHVQNITIKNSSFNTTGHNAIAVQCHGTVSFDHGAIIIENNEFNNIGDRIIRFNNVGGTSIKIVGNTAIESGDDEGEVIKATALAEGIVYEISGNNWGEGKTIANPEFADVA